MKQTMGISVALCGLLLTAIFFFRLKSALQPPKPVHRVAGSPTRMVVVLGSGGHTAELLTSLRSLHTSRYTHRTYIVSSGDVFSAQRAESFEQTLSGLAELRRKPSGSFDIAVVPRARKVHQSLLTTPWSCLRCFLACVRVLATAPKGYQKQWHAYMTQGSAVNLRQTNQELIRLGVSPFPDLIITNGPATGLVVVLAAVALRFSGVAKPRKIDRGGAMRSLFIESWARVKRLSLTGRILLATGACQRIIVQWKNLKDQIGPRVDYIGPVVK